MIDRARLIAPFSSDNDEDGIDFPRYNQHGKLILGTVVRETASTSTNKQISIPGYVRSMKFFSEEWLSVETNSPFVCQLKTGNGSIGGRITINRPFEVIEWFILFQGKIWQVNTDGVISIDDRTRTQPGIDGYSNSNISQAELDTQLKSAVISKVRSRLVSMIEWAHDRRNQDEYFRARMGRDDMLSHYLRNDEAILFAFCEEQKECADVSIKTIRCYRQMIDAGTVP
jgi:hypothetical protein